MAASERRAVESVKLISMHKDDGVPLGGAKQRRKLYFLVQGWGFSPALFVAVYIPQEWRKIAVCIPQFLPVGHYLLIEDNR